MAKSIVNEVVNPIYITIVDTGEEFELEFNRESVVFTNRQGFKLSEFSDNMEEMLPILFYGAFRMHHKKVSRQKTDQILFDYLGGLTDEAAERLLQLYSAPRKAMMKDDEDEGDEKNAKATVRL